MILISSKYSQKSSKTHPKMALHAAVKGKLISVIGDEVKISVTCRIHVSSNIFLSNV